MNNLQRVRPLTTQEKIYKIELVPLDSVKLWQKNARKNKEAVPKLGRTLMVHGQVTPVVVWIKNNVIYKGNTTWKALDWWRNLPNNEYFSILKELDLPRDLPKPKVIKVLYVNFKDEESAVAYGIADNKSSEWSMWDEDKLEGLIKEYYSDISKMKESGKISQVGFSTEELTNLMMIPNLQKIKKSNMEIELKGTIKLNCSLDVKDELKDWLLENLEDNGFKNVEVI